MARYRRSRGYYKFTPKRKAALRRAQFISAKNRKGKGLNKLKVAGGVAALAGLGTASYFGMKHRDAIGKHVSGWTKPLRKSKERSVTSPEMKEATRAANAISVGPPSVTQAIIPTTITPPTGDIGWYAKHQAEQTRKSLEPKAPRNRDSQKATDRAVKNVLRAHDKGILNSSNEIKSITDLAEEGKKITRGRGTSSLRSTPGGTRTPRKAVRPNTANGLTEAEHAAAIGFDTELYQPPAPIKASFKRERKDELHTLAGMRAADEKLLSGTSVPAKKAPAKKAPAKKAPAKKAAPRKSASKPTAPTTGTAVKKDAKPPIKVTPVSTLPGHVGYVDWKKANQIQNRIEAERLKKLNENWNKLFGDDGLNW